MLVRTRPFNPVFDRRFDRAFDQLTSSFVGRRPPHAPSSTPPGPTASLVLTVDLPGTPGDAVDVAVAGRTLTLSATTPERGVGAQRAPRRRPRPRAGVGPYVDGRLTVTVGAVAAAEPRRIEIATTPAPAIEVEVAAGRVRRSGGERHQRQRLIGQRGELGRHRHEVARRQRPARPPPRRPAPPPSPRVASRASTAYGTRSRSTPTEQTTSTGRAVGAPAERRARRPVLDVGPRAPAAAPAPARRRPTQAGLLLEPPAQQALGGEAVQRVGGASARGGRRRPATTPASASTVGTSPWMMANASRSWAPTPTSRRTAPVWGSSTTRQTSRPRTSPVTTPCSTTGTAPPASIVSTSARCAGSARRRDDRRLGDRREQRPLVDVPHVDRQRRSRRPGGRAARSPARRARAAGRRRWRTRPGQRPGRGRARGVLEQHPGRRRTRSSAAPGGNAPGRRRSRARGGRARAPAA